MEQQPSKYQVGDYVFVRGQVMENKSFKTEGHYQVLCVDGTGKIGKDYAIQIVPEEYLVSIKEALEIIKGRSR
jgi:hypothetical protein|tara:strand:- start:179 stop:397 length:219 start_codon:yes stop_codon:yes gene_type:complete